MTDPLTDRHPLLTKVLADGLWGLDAVADRLERALDVCVWQPMELPRPCGWPREDAIHGEGTYQHPYQPLVEVTR